MNSWSKPMPRNAAIPDGVLHHAAYLSKLREAMLKRLDCSAIINESGGFYLSAATVKLQDGKVLRMEKS